MNSVRRLSCLCLATIMTMIASPARVMAWDADDLGRRASWMPVASETAQEQITSWLQTLELPADQKQQLLSLWHDAGQLPPAELHSRFIETARQVDQRIDELVNRCQGPWRPESEALPEVLSDSRLPAWVRSNLRLYYASWLAHHQLYNELHQTLDGVLLNEVFDPGALLFFQSVGQHRRLERDACLATLRKLLENEATLPQRYVKLAKLMQADLEPLKPDSLDEISRIMDNIQVTLGHGALASWYGRTKRRSSASSINSSSNWKIKPVLRPQPPAANREATPTRPASPWKTA